MENWLHIGIDKKQLEEEYTNLLNSKFPDIPDEDELYDLFSELTLLDGHISGLISSYLRNTQINFKLLDVDDEFNSLLSDISIESESLDEILKRKKQLDKLLQMIKKIEGII